MPWYPRIWYLRYIGGRQPPRIARKTWGQFHQHSTSSFYTCRSQMHQKDLWFYCLFFTLSVSSSVKVAQRLLMKLTPGLNFISILYTAFTLADSKSVKKTVRLSIFFTLSGSTSIKASHKTLVKLTPVQFSLFISGVNWMWKAKLQKVSPT